MGPEYQKRDDKLPGYLTKIIRLGQEKGSSLIVGVIDLYNKMALTTII
jgi:hypothetical protein